MIRGRTKKGEEEKEMEKEGREEQDREVERERRREERFGRGGRIERSGQGRWKEQRERGGEGGGEVKRGIDIANREDWGVGEGRGEVEEEVRIKKKSEGRGEGWPWSYRCVWSHDGRPGEFPPSADDINFYLLSLVLSSW